MRQLPFLSVPSRFISPASTICLIALATVARLTPLFSAIYWYVAAGTRRMISFTRFWTVSFTVSFSVSSTVSSVLFLGSFSFGDSAKGKATRMKCSEILKMLLSYERRIRFMPEPSCSTRSKSLKNLLIGFLVQLEGHRSGGYKTTTQEGFFSCFLIA